jgi:hypothetical protein
MAHYDGPDSNPLTVSAAERMPTQSITDSSHSFPALCAGYTGSRLRTSERTEWGRNARRAKRSPYAQFTTCGITRSRITDSVKRSGLDGISTGTRLSGTTTNYTSGNAPINDVFSPSERGRSGKQSAPSFSPESLS